MPMPLSASAIAVGTWTICCTTLGVTPASPKARLMMACMAGTFSRENAMKRWPSRSASRAQLCCASGWSAGTARMKWSCSRSISSASQASNSGVRSSATSTVWAASSLTSSWVVDSCSTSSTRG
ncbi:Uncharacterised protein [Bordetella pertussis]|nr:Uncharacterised protein [Bordetella pertussis]CFM35731.1 Uncharacterised protein [Bordetella pertussis]CFM61341.1 Uncharacterised protein [Bordetella pertussis]CFM91689.1 Uncharacterised protein [Bordetella pertussis]CFN02154.1 Uncharacterised protein [Bordetella pertussis]